MAATSASSQCSEFTSLATSYNEDPFVIAYSGLFFSVDVKEAPIDVLTLEVDVLSAASALAIAVFTREGDYQGLEMDQTSWLQLANTILVPIPDQYNSTRYMLPATQFDAIRLNPFTRHSFYITMLGPWIDNTVTAVDQTGLVAYDDPYVSLLSGSGAMQPYFAAAIDTTTAPRFAGVWHYRVDQSDCPEEYTQTSVVFRFQFDQEAMALTVATAVSDEVASRLDGELNIGSLQGYRMVDNLQRAAVPSVQVEDQACESGWTVCTTLAVSVDYVHNRSLDGGVLEYQLYRTKDLLLRAVEQVIGSYRVKYVGYKDAAADFGIVLRNLPYGQTMNEVQKAYFMDRTRDYLNRTLTEIDQSRVLAVEIYNQVPQTRRLRALQETAPSGDLLLSGRLLGAQLNNFVDATFLLDLEQALLTDQPKYLTEMRLGLIEPGEINVGDDYLLLNNLEQIDSEVELYVPPPLALTSVPSMPPPPTEAPTSSSRSNSVDTSVDAVTSVDPMVWVYVGVGVGIVLLFITMCVAWCLLKRRKRRNGKVPLKKSPKQARHTTKDQGSVAPSAASSVVSKQEPATAPSPSTPKRQDQRTGAPQKHSPCSILNRTQLSPQTHVPPMRSRSYVDPGSTAVIEQDQQRRHSYAPRHASPSGGRRPTASPRIGSEEGTGIALDQYPEVTVTASMEGQDHSEWTEGFDSEEDEPEDFIPDNLDESDGSTSSDDSKEGAVRRNSYVTPYLSQADPRTNNSSIVDWRDTGYYGESKPVSLSVFKREETPRPATFLNSSQSLPGVRSKPERSKKPWNEVY